MDPITHGVLGAAAGQSASQRREIRLAALAGLAGGMAPDLDVLIRSSSDPLLIFEYHRHFTHSLVFIPVGGLIVSFLLWMLFRRWNVRFWRLYLFATLGYATHSLLDASTSYGTMLLWPFSNARIAWDFIAIVDPLFTLPILAGGVLAFITKNRRWAVAALCFALAYLAFGLIQRERAEAMIAETALMRGHDYVRIDAKPNLGNLFVWRTMYESNGRYYIDALRLGTFADNKLFEGDSVEKVDTATAFPELSRDSVQYKDLLRFRWFADDWLARAPSEPNIVGDLRYGRLPNSIEPLWGIRVAPDAPDAHVKYESLTGIGDAGLIRSVTFGLK